MLNHYFATLLLVISLEGILLSASPGYKNRSSSNDSRNTQSGISDESTNSSTQPWNQGTGREEIVYMDERDRDIHFRANRRGDWGYKQNWRYDREAFYKGATQDKAYDYSHPDGVGGIGIDPDPEYLQMRRFYLEEQRKNRQAAIANQKANNNRSQTNHSSNNTNQANNKRPQTNQPSSVNQENNHVSYQPRYINWDDYNGGYYRDKIWHNSPTPSNYRTGETFSNEPYYNPQSYPSNGYYYYR